MTTETETQGNTYSLCTDHKAEHDKAGGFCKANRVRRWLYNRKYEATSKKGMVTTDAPEALVNQMIEKYDGDRDKIDFKADDGEETEGGEEGAG